MIYVKPKIHDNFSVEFKVGFVPKNIGNENIFKINTWFFFPNSLDINPETYEKKLFYQDVKSNIRLITPSFDIDKIVSENALPLSDLQDACKQLSQDPSNTNSVAELEIQIKMFAAIVKSALRNATVAIELCNSIDEIRLLASDYITNSVEIVSAYRQCKKEIDKLSIEADYKHYFSFGDEFLSHIIDLYSFRIIDRINKIASSSLDQVSEKLMTLIKCEKEYKIANAYLVADSINNENVVYRYGMLKKFVESDLFIKLDKKRDAYAIEQLYLSIAAGLAMIVATLITFIFQSKFGSVSLPLFLALVIGYMLKDRIKALTRYYFVHRFGNKYYDNKAKINISNDTIGWIKEGADFISESKVPDAVMEMRNRSSLLKSENRLFDEKIILYRKRVYIDGAKFAKVNKYKKSGINDILRFYINHIVRKMDNPEVPFKTINDKGEIEIVNTAKIYYINIIMQIRYENQFEYKRFRVILSRSRILDIETLS